MSGRQLSLVLSKSSMWLQNLCLVSKVVHVISLNKVLYVVTGLLYHVQTNVIA